MRTIIYFIIILLLAYSCQTEQADNVPADQKSVVNIRLKSSPDRLMPLLSKSSYASNVEFYLYSSLYFYDEPTGQMIPYLAEEDVKINTDSNYTYYTYHIRDNALWDDGTAITAQDFEFTLKWALNPIVNGSGIQSYISLIDSIQLYPDDSQKFTVWMNESYILAQEAIGTMPIMQKGFLDPDGKLDNLALTHIGALNQESDKEIVEYFLQLESSSYGRDSISGSGPYRLTDWQSDRYVTIERKTDWWGNPISLKLLPEDKITQINFLIVPDESVSRVMFKKGEIDILTSLSPNTYNEMEKEYGDSAQFFHPLTSKFYILSINNKDKLLKYKEVRAAFNALIDTEKLIEMQLQGRAQAIHGPIHPSASYAINTDKNTPSGITAAGDILDKSGWKDTDGDGVRDKNIQGRKVQLQTSIQVSSGKLGQMIALILKENAAKIGMTIDIQSSDFSIIRGRMEDRSYTMTPLVIKTSGMLYDPYQTWHSDNSVSGKSNFSSYSNPQVDSIISALRMEPDTEKRKAYYSAFQHQVISDLPVIFLAAPEELIVCKNNINIQTHAIAPGYYLQSTR